jgi:predicted HAD superfamily Cof-like phosphohydrolase
MQSHQDMVREFTQASGFDVPKKPHPMSETQVEFLCSMILDETLELLATVKSADYAKEFLLETITSAKFVPQVQSKDPAVILAEQADALVDIEYYMLNAACKNGISIDPVFEEAHNANMRKRDPQTLQFIRHPGTGKILKPEGWKAPDVISIFRQQLE